MTFDLEGDHATYAYKILAALVVPRPIALVTTQDADGVVNAADLAALLGAWKTGHVSVLGDISAMPLIAIVRNIEADLVQARSPPQNFCVQRIIEVPRFTTLN